MERTPVASSNVKSIGYHDGTLEVEFLGDPKKKKPGGVYQYAGVPQGVYVEFMKAPSKGKYLAASIKDKFKARRVA